MHPRQNEKSRIRHYDYETREFSLPAKRSLVYISLITALLINLVPFDNVILVLRPDFVALTLLYWNIYQPQQVGMSAAFISGLFMDVIDISIMGQHAIAYCLITFFALILHRRLRLFNAFQQVPAILWILLLGQTAVFLTGILAGTYIPEWYIFLASVTGALCWPLLVFLLGNFRRQRIDRDEV
ncbi:rod shape-determining protein MreD [Nitrosomonas sp. HPC101]|uniref:rod shape-determining protein MreD n=1 Tax=Nitrosomonas sp. HPC101 TaxID=1658667 RepID=UPI0013689ABA|nr:rod shape-determining protein MreD [Nitrosomonas sp. HPC101]MXS85725.1 rod shape-determining protein MreD [Nitrosomonas sp. HPC101]